MINSQTYLTSVMGTSNQMRRPLLFSLRGNQTINRALRAAYRKFDRTRRLKSSCDGIFVKMIQLWLSWRLLSLRLRSSACAVARSAISSNIAAVGFRIATSKRTAPVHTILRLRCGDKNGHNPNRVYVSELPTIEPRKASLCSSGR